MESNAGNIKSNFIYNVTFQVLLLILPFITTPYVSRVLGAENVGRYSYSCAMASYFTILAALGSDTYGRRKVAYFRDKKEMLSSVFWNTVAFRFVMSGISLVLYGLYLVASKRVNALDLIVGVGILNVALDISWFFQGMENFKNTVFRNLTVRLILFAGIFIFVKESKDLWKYVLIIVSSQTLGSLSLWCLIPRLVQAPKHVRPFEGFRDIWQIFLPSIAIQVYTVLDKSMIGWFTQSSYANGCYEQSERIVRLALTVVTSISTVVFPRVANLFHKNNMEEAKEYIYLAFRIVWLTAIPIMLGLIATASIFIPIFLGSGYSDAIGLLIIFSFLIIPVSITNVAGISYLIPTGQQRIYTLAVTIAALANFFMNLVLIPRSGAFGAAVASVLAETLGMIVQITYCITTRQLSPKRIIYPLGKYLVSGLVMFICVEALKRKLLTGIISLGVLIACGAAVYFGCAILLKDKLMLQQIKKIRRH